MLKVNLNRHCFSHFFTKSYTWPVVRIVSMRRWSDLKINCLIKISAYIRGNRVFTVRKQIKNQSLKQLFTSGKQKMSFVCSVVVINVLWMEFILWFVPHWLCCLSVKWNVLSVKCEPVRDMKRCLSWWCDFKMKTFKTIKYLWTQGGHLSIDSKGILLYAHEWKVGLL